MELRDIILLAVVIAGCVLIITAAVLELLDSLEDRRKYKRWLKSKRH